MTGAWRRSPLLLSCTSVHVAAQNMDGEKPEKRSLEAKAEKAAKKQRKAEKAAKKAANRRRHV